MTRAPRRLRALIAPLSVVALSLVAIRPWWKLELVCSDDISFHLLRVVQLEALLRQGVIFSRWAPDMGLGYGVPFFNFYAPLAYYVPALLNLIGLDPQPALFFAFALATIGAGLSAYLLARDYFSPPSSLVAATAYVYAPYLAYDALFRGNLAETAAWALLPLPLWGIGRLAQRGGTRYLAVTALSYAAVLLTHNVFALVFSPLLGAYALLTALRPSIRGEAYATSWAKARLATPPRYHRLALAGVALLLGLGLATFFWLPAIVERAHVHIDRLLTPPHFTYWNNFLDPLELIAAPRTIHPDLLNPSPPRTLGLVPILMSLPALACLRRLRGQARRLHIAFFAAASIFFAWLTTASSRLVWDSIPLLKYAQFPWRLLGPAALCLAMLIAAATELLPIDRRGNLLRAAVIILLIGTALFWLDPRYCPGMKDPTVADIPPFEQATHFIGTTAKGEYLPRTVKKIPEEIARGPLNPSSIPSGTVITDSYKKMPIGAELTISALQPFTAVYNSFAYPGWQVTIDSTPIPIIPGVPYGRMTFPIPEGEHHVSIRFRETALRCVADCVSLSCLALTVASLLWKKGRLYATGDLSHLREVRGGQRLSWLWIGLGLTLLVVVSQLRQVNTPLYRPGLQEGIPPNLDTVVNVPFEGGLTLLGFRLNKVPGEQVHTQAQTTVASGDNLRLDLFWTTWEPPPSQYQRKIVLLGPKRLRWSPEDSLPPRGFREPPETQAWPADVYVQDSHLVEIPPGTPPGTYDLSLILFEGKTLQEMRVLQAGGQFGHPSLRLGQVTVTRPRQSIDPTEVKMQYPMNAALGSLTLLDVNVNRAEVAPGDPLLFTLFWLATERPETDLSIRLTLLTPDGLPIATFDRPPTTDSHSPSSWQAGDLWRGQHLVHLPATLDDGDYTWHLTILPTGQSTHLPPNLHVTAPNRTFDRPPVDVQANLDLGNVATLVGAVLEPRAANLQSATSLTVTLVWRAKTETHTSYHAFLHLLDPDGDIVAQSDGVPAGWTRPTTGWLPGEYITDVHTLALPPDAASTSFHIAAPSHIDGSTSTSYRLLAGLYNPVTGKRLATTQGVDAIHVAEIIIGTEP